VPSYAAPRQLIEYAQENAIPGIRDAADKNWFRSTISTAKWSSQFPYQLKIVKLEGGRYQTATFKGATFTLPVPPESLEISTPFAINTTLTMGGSIEEHSGSPVRQISIAGSFGHLPFRGAAARPSSISFSEAVFAGTIQAAGTVLSAVNALQGKPLTFNVHNDEEFASEEGQGKLTGYFQARAFQGFLESYAELKKSALADARLYRLVLSIHKDDSHYLVTPVTLNVLRSASSPLEYRFSLVLKSTKRIDLNSAGPLQSSYRPIQREPNRMARLLTTSENARKVLQGAKRTILAVGGDLSATIGGTLRELTLFAKDALSVPLSLADLSDQLIQDTKRAVLDLKATGSAIANFPQNFETRFKQVSQNASEINSLLGFAAGEGGDSPETDISAHPAFQAFENPSDNYDFFSSVSVSDLTLSPALVTKVAEERDRVTNLTRDDFRARRDAIQKGIVAISQALGVSHPTFEATYGIAPAPATLVDEVSDDDFEVLFVLNQLVMDLNRLVIQSTNQPSAIMDTLSSVAGMAEASGIAFTVPRSKFAVPFPYGNTLEQLSARYLGTPARWHEIAALNGLRAPFVDEEGFSLPLVANGSGNNVIVTDVSNLHVGKVVWIGSSFATRTRRKVRQIEKLTPTQWLVTVDGDPDLDKYQTLAEAYLFAFLPATVNSQQLIYIPSNVDPGPRDFRTTDIPGVDSQDPYIAVGGVSVLLTPKGDFVLGKNGGTKWAVGLTNISQRLRLMFTTRKGTLLDHPEYGLPIEAGMSIADFTASDIARSIDTMVSLDPTFAGVESVTVQIDGPITKIGAGIMVKNIDTIIPVFVET
jgi:hypothetical protein